MMKAMRRLYRTIDGEVVGEGDPRARFLLAGVGDEVPDGYDVPAELDCPDPPDPDAPADPLHVNQPPPRSIVVPDWWRTGNLPPPEPQIVRYD